MEGLRKNSWNNMDQHFSNIKKFINVQKKEVTKKFL